MKFDSASTSRFLKNTPRIVDVNYDEDRKFKKFTSNDVLAGKVRPEQVQGKIVLFGMLGPGDEDKFFTPLNGAKKDRGEPDMYGVEYLARIVAQVLEY
jgi:CHASE2 domain-containing sensor protein